MSYAWRQLVGPTAIAAATSPKQTTLGPVLQGSTIFVFIVNDNKNDGVPIIQDSLGNPYQLLDFLYGPLDAGTSLFMIENTPASTSVVVSIGNVTGNLRVFTAEVTGLAIAHIQDAFTSNVTFSTTSLTMGPITTTQAVDSVLAFMYSESTSARPLAVSGYTTQATDNSAASQILIADKVLSTAGSTSMTVTSGSSTTMHVFMLAARQLVSDPSFINSNLTVTKQPTTAVIGSPFEAQPIITVRDSSNAIVTSSTATVYAAIYSGSGLLLGTRSAVAVAGEARFTSLQINSTAGTHVLKFFADGCTPIATSNIMVVNSIAQLITQTLVPTARDSVGTIIPPGSHGPASFSSDNTAVATVNATTGVVTAVGVGQCIITITIDGISTTAPVTVV